MEITRITTDTLDLIHCKSCDAIFGVEKFTDSSLISDPKMKLDYKYCPFCSSSDIELIIDKSLKNFYIKHGRCPKCGSILIHDLNIILKNLKSVNNFKLQPSLTGGLFINLFCEKCDEYTITLSTNLVKTLKNYDDITLDEFIKANFKD
jgi:hypothetical protein